jgi:hypothetical protein
VSWTSGGRDLYFLKKAIVVGVISVGDWRTGLHGSSYFIEAESVILL